MKTVNNSLQDLYENRVLDTFYKVFNECNNCQKAFTMHYLF